MRRPSTRQVRSVAYRLERRWDRLVYAIKKRFGLFKRPVIMPYRGYGDRTLFWGRGRVLEDPGLAMTLDGNSVVTMLRRAARRYRTDEVPGAKVHWSLGAMSGSVVTDAEGYYEFSFEPGEDFDPDAPWHEVELRLEPPSFYPGGEVDALHLVRTPSENATIGIISDIDDTIVETGAYSLFKHWKTVIANTAETRTAFPGTGAFYRALSDGVAGDETNPVFYVSSSPWNIYDLFERFMSLNEIPLGPMLLKDFGLTEEKWFTGGHDGHKTAMIGGIMEAFPDLKFLLIGDSGQRDAAIYAQVVRARPERIAAVFLRDVRPGRENPDIFDLHFELAPRGIPCSVSDDLGEAAEMAAQAGWITAAQAQAVHHAASRSRETG